MAADDSPSPTGPPDLTARPSTGAALRASTQRPLNLAAVVRTVVASPDELSRADVAATLGLTRSTASRLVDELVAAGLLTELKARHPSGRGRPGTPLAASADIAALGLEVGTTSLTARLVDLRGTVLGERHESGDFAASTPGRVLRRLDRLGTQLLHDRPRGMALVGTALALPGIVDTASGTLLTAPNLGWTDVRPSTLVDVGVTPGETLMLGNEADMSARAVAEVAPGRAGPLEDFFYLSGETGIGGAAVLGGQVMTGRHGWAGEIGHVSVDPRGPVCRCSSTGCLELYAGRRALLETAGLDEHAAPREVADRALAGDPAAQRAIEQAATALAVALGGVINVLDIHVVVLGGHLGQVADAVAPRLEEELMRRVLSARWVSPRVEAHRTDDRPAATGAALMQLNRVIDDPGAWISRLSLDPARKIS